MLDLLSHFALRGEVSSWNTHSLTGKYCAKPLPFGWIMKKALHCNIIDICCLDCCAAVCAELFELSAKVEFKRYNLSAPQINKPFCLEKSTLIDL